MITQDKVVSVVLGKTELDYIRSQSKRAEIGGASNVRSQAERQSTLSEDQLIGQVGTFAGHKFMFGNSFLYRLSRAFANIYPTIGDGGSDVPGANIDFKASLIRTSLPLLEHRLIVRPKERHKGVVYVLVLVSYSEHQPNYTEAHLVGWISESELPATVDAHGPFSGAYTVRASQLHPMMPITWFGAA